MIIASSFSKKFTLTVFTIQILAFKPESFVLDCSFRWEGSFKFLLSFFYDVDWSNFAWVEEIVIKADSDRGYWDVFELLIIGASLRGVLNWWKFGSIFGWAWLLGSEVVLFFTLVAIW